MNKIISALYLYDINKTFLETLSDKDLSNVDLREPVIISRKGIIKSNAEPLLKVLSSKDLVNVFYKFEDEI